MASIDIIESITYYILANRTKAPEDLPRTFREPAEDLPRSNAEV